MSGFYDADAYTETRSEVFTYNDLEQELGGASTRIDIYRRVVDLFNQPAFATISTSVKQVFADRTIKDKQTALDSWLTTQGFTVEHWYSLQAGKVGALINYKGLPLAIKLMDAADVSKEVKVSRVISPRIVNLLYFTVTHGDKAIVFFERFERSYDEICKHKAIVCLEVMKQCMSILRQFHDGNLVHGHPHFANYAYVGGETVIFDFDLVRDIGSLGERTLKDMVLIVKDLKTVVKSVATEARRHIGMEPPELVECLESTGDIRVRGGIFSGPPGNIFRYPGVLRILAQWYKTIYPLKVNNDTVIPDNVFDEIYKYVDKCIQSTADQLSVLLAERDQQEKHDAWEDWLLDDDSPVVGYYSHRL